MQEGTFGEVRLFAGNFAPRDWAFCEGQLLSIAENEALFSVLGTTYGGDGRTTFGLPDLRGRVPVGVGQGPGLPEVRLGQKVGAEQVADASGSQDNITRPGLGLHWVICTNGVYPQRGD